MKERPILMTSMMVRACLRSVAGKTHTRRGVKGQHRGAIDVAGAAFDASSNRWFWHNSDGSALGLPGFKCPYGVVGDRLWVREACARSRNKWLYRADFPESGGPRDVTDEWDWDDSMPNRWRPSIHMPRVACRIERVIECIRIERIQDISEADALAEGIMRFTKDGVLMKYWPCDPDDAPKGLECTWRDMPSDPRVAFRALVEWIHGPDYWTDNPWVWVVVFKRVEAKA